jgi:hypothetical protein
MQQDRQNWRYLSSVICPLPSETYFTVTTGQGAFKTTYWAVEPKMIFPTLDLRLPIPAPT